jgi:DNA-directed RNA polymerase I, II, and III subunit RPABC1
MLADQSEIDRQRDITRIWRIHKTVHKMAKDRGYSVPENEYTISLDDFKQRHGNTDISRASLVYQFNKEDQEADDPKLAVFFTEETSIGVKTIRQFVQLMSDKQVLRAIIIIRQAITSAASKVMQNLPKLKFECFYENELLVNITEHQLVPKHELLTPAEKKELLQKYHLKEVQLPRMQLADPVAR